MTEEQIQDIAMGVVAAAMESQTMMMPSVREAEEQMQPQMGMPQ
jgi:hypothetical protein